MQSSMASRWADQCQRYRERRETCAMDAPAQRRSRALKSVPLFCRGNRDRGGVALDLESGAEGFGELGDALEDVTGAGAGSRRGQTDGVEKLVIGVLVMDVGLTLAER